MQTPARHMPSPTAGASAVAPRRRRLGALLLLCLAVVGCGTAPDPRAPATPSPAAPPSPAIVVAAHPLAARAGAAVLERGGSAMDAALAVQLMLGLVEPQSSGIGGGTMLLAYDAGSGQVSGYIGREQAPAAAGAGWFDDADGQPLARSDAMLSGRATGVPGTLATFALALREHGRLPWARLFDDTIATAEQGFTITARLQRHIDGRFPQAAAEDVRRLFDDGHGGRLRAGDTLRNPAYAATLRTLAAGGAQAFYQGALARAYAGKGMALMPAAEAAEQTIVQKVVPYETQGRVFGFAASVESAASPISAYLIGPIAQFWLIPFMETDAGRDGFGWLLGDGDARGIALVFVIAGLLTFLLVLLAFCSRAYRRLTEAYAAAP
ncbi:MAG: hypothetical protein E2593_02365 [Stenotrophomonas sp.]|nr:hypothetical protein [Stenotrophomonas sp.]